MILSKMTAQTMGLSSYRGKPPIPAPSVDNGRVRGGGSPPIMSRNQNSLLRRFGTMQSSEEIGRDRLGRPATRLAPPFASTRLRPKRFHLNPESKARGRARMCLARRQTPRARRARSPANLHPPAAPPTPLKTSKNQSSLIWRLQRCKAGRHLKASSRPT